MSKRNSRDLVVISEGLTLPGKTTAILEKSSSLSEIDAGDQYLPYYCFNVRLKGKDDEWLPRNVFFHTLREDTKPEINSVLLFLHKTYRYRIFTEGEGSKTICQSLDRVEGIRREDGVVIRCFECEYSPSRPWQNGRPPLCKLCYSFVGIDIDDREPFIITTKSTSATPTKRFLNKFFLRKLKGKDLPLFVYKTRLGLEMPEGTYAVITYETTETNSPSEIERYAKICEELMASSKIDYTFEQPEDVSEEEVEVPF